MIQTKQKGDYGVTKGDVLATKQADDAERDLPTLMKTRLALALAVSFTTAGSVAILYEPVTQLMSQAMQLITQ